MRNALLLLALSGCVWPESGRRIRPGPNTDADLDGFTIGEGDCDDSDAAIFPGAEDTVDEAQLDSNCDGVDGVDHDQDGFASIASGGSDCDDEERAINPLAPDAVGDEIDHNCDGHDGTDVDQDGFASLQSGGDDCDDVNRDRNPAAEDQVDSGGDENCDGVDGVDADGDGYASQSSGGSDCDDADVAVAPGSQDLVGDGVDQNCDGVDGIDADADGVASQASGGPDCDDQAHGTFPGAPDAVGDDTDQNCDGIDGVDADGDGVASTGSGGPDCDDAAAGTLPGAPDLVGDGVDQNCDGVDGVDADGDGVASTGTGGEDCDDTDSSSHPNATDLVGDGIDRNCDGHDGEDDDQDGQASLASGGTDCDDGNAFVLVGAVDLAGDAVDQNCDGTDGIDGDGDGYASVASGGVDCDDALDAVNPGVGLLDLWDGVDQNCDGVDGVDGTVGSAIIVMDALIDQVKGLSDLDGDTRGDVAVVSDEKVYLFSGAMLQIGTTVTPSDALAEVTLPATTFGNQRSLSSGDTNGDGQAELAVGIQSYEGGAKGGDWRNQGVVLVFEGADLGGLMDQDDASNRVYGLLYADYGYHLGGVVDLSQDIDGDGKTDLLVSSGAGDPYPGSGPILITGPTLTGGDHSITDGDYTLMVNGGVPVAAILDDLNGDGWREIAFQVDDPSGGYICVMDSSLTGLVGPQCLATVDEFRRPYALGDMDGDGASEVLLRSTNEAYSTASWQGAVSLPGPLFSFPHAEDFHQGLPWPDFNADGLADALYGQNEGLILGRLGLSGSIDVDIALGTMRAASHADLDGDGKSDLLQIKNDTIGGFYAVYATGMSQTLP